MTFEVLFSDRAMRDLSGLPREIQLRVLSSLEKAAKDPARFFRRLTGARTFRMRVGDYRILADLDMEARHILVAHIGHRRNVYR